MQQISMQLRCSFRHVLREGNEIINGLTREGALSLCFLVLHYFIFFNVMF